MHWGGVKLEVVVVYGLMILRGLEKNIELEGVFGFEKWVSCKFGF
jgi:hypothetical protein